MDLKITCKKLEIDGWDCNYKSVTISMDDINTDQLNTVEVAEKVDLDNMFEAHGEEEILSYVKANYDWFNKEEE